MQGLHIQSVSKSFGTTNVIKSVDLEIEPGEFVVFVGPSGCGKSTLLRMIAGLETISSGRIDLNGRRIDLLEPADRRVSMVFQTYALYPHMNVRENMDFGLRINRAPKEKREREVKEAASMLSLSELLERKPGALSGGQRQRVAIGRSIVRHPELFLFDEPLSNLDAALRGKMRIELARLQRELGATMIYVTHDQVEAMTMADRIVVLNGGRVEQVGAPLDLFHRPANRFVAGFLGAPTMNFIPVRIEDGALYIDGHKAVDVSAWDQRQVGRAKYIGVRPENISIDYDGDTGMRASVSAVERLGSQTHVHLESAGGHSLVSVSQGTARAEPGDLVGLQLDFSESHLFDDRDVAIPRVDATP
ncbi:ABC transporter ATP-binding protein [Frigidibacter sp. ROC022]|uniref:ABC transporter ATP-binding protein n=1 Tax=Frigidibacter sp. ROC022 TaxID=2971796 RepID=UPI00215AB24B|nr:sn-glycerol-3-phosphate ABC transporter ATP-binding protein UgpC [Frigidibacter sp. ROC022]MCR8724629.1 sn-glycerol-3-phosphate ABC transporter ATP-binding protein UgpC [Frigidibacter sp. ROC022]